MTTPLSQRELRNDSGAVMRKLDAGEDFILTRNGIPVGRITPLKPRQFVPAEALIAAFRTSPQIDRKKLRADLDTYADPYV